MADKLIICVCQHQVLFDKRHTNDKNNNLKDNMWQSITVTSANVC